MTSYEHVYFNFSVIWCNVFSLSTHWISITFALLSINYSVSVPSLTSLEFCTFCSSEPQSSQDSNIPIGTSNFNFKGKITYSLLALHLLEKNNVFYFYLAKRSHFTERSSWTSRQLRIVFIWCVKYVLVQLIIQLCIECHFQCLFLKLKSQYKIVFQN